MAKEACDIVILDDNIKSMTKAVLWGRNVYESIRKFLQFQLVVNVVAVTLNFVSACAGVPLPLGAVPLLWVNMIMDSMGALALATEPPRDELLQRKPYGRRAPLINREMYRNIVGVSIFQLVVSLVLQYAGKQLFNIENGKIIEPKEISSGDLEINSIIFNTFVFMQIGSEINSRRIGGKDIFNGILKSFWFITILIVTVVIQLALMLGVAGTRVGEAIGIVRIRWSAWIASIVLGLLILPWGWLVRFYPLEWCFGPTDEDRLQMSKLERLLHLPKRKPLVAADEGEDEDDQQQEDVKEAADMHSAPAVSNRLSIPTDGSSSSAITTGISVHPQGSTPHSQVSPSIIRLRVFVHAVAFVNVVSRGKISGSGP